MIARKKTVAVALSGGIDSSCAAAILLDKGWKVTGVHLMLPVQRSIMEERKEKVRLFPSLSEIQKEVQMVPL